MSQKEFVFEEAARQKLLEGILAFAEVLMPTFGPNGLNIALDSPYGSPKLTAYGREIGREIELKDPYANMGVTLAKEMASQVEKACGDGTTLATILLASFAKEGVKMLSTGVSPLHIKEGIKKAALFASDFIEKKAGPIRENADLKKIALLATHQDEKLADLIYEAIEKVGTEGIIRVKEGKGVDSTLEMGKGIFLERGYASAYFCTDTQKQIVDMEEVKILITSERIASIHDILPLLQTISSTSNNLVIIADDFEADVISGLAINKLKGLLKIAAIKAPGSPNFKKALLEDIALLTGGILVSEERGLSLKTSGFEVLGSVKKITITKETATLEIAKDRLPDVKDRLLSLEKQIKEAKNAYEREKLEERKGILSAQIAFLYVGALTEVELKRKKALLENALTSIRASLEKGTVLGGGLSLLHASVALDPLRFKEEERLGVMIVKKGLAAPFKQLIKNAGLEPAIYIDKVLSLHDENMGFNALTLKIENLAKAGVIDPAKVVLSALECATSSASLFLLSEVLIADCPAKEGDIKS